MKNIIFTLFIFSCFTASSFGYDNPVLRIYTDNVENTFEVGEQAVFFADILTDFEYPSGDAEFVVEAVIVGFPVIKLKSTRISETYYSFTSPELKETDVGRRYIQVQVKTGPRKESNRIKDAIKKNSQLLIEEIINRDNATSVEMREYYQLRIDRMQTFENTLMIQLDNLLSPVGPPAELSFSVFPSTGSVNFERW